MKIHKLCLYTSDVRRQYSFYKDDLGMEIINYEEDSFEVQCGFSILRFEFKENSVPTHFAFHIPDEQEQEALNWLKTVVPVLKYNDEQIIDFSNWNAKSVYFYDKDRNIVEFISRRNFSKPEQGIFTAENIVGIAEIGLATSNIKETFKQLNVENNLHKYDGYYEHFCAIGEDSGLFIVVNKHNKEWFPTNDNADPSDFKLNFEHENKQFQLKFENDTIKISE
ncbi:VOC family protein [uncultured Christiangramia sp.]|uniref:VOC family protein n=1 Tax=uncultured Christiangramia sp. TaxID=503836 RepID=UPI00262ADA04|nr:VOC family protein [uncultured Christiangramia sp.]